MNTEIIDRLRIYEQITRAIQVFDGGGRIVSMQVATAPPQPDPDTGAPPVVSSASIVSVDTRDILYPPQMVDAIKEALNNRRQTIADQLAELGVTGLGT